MWYSYSDVKDTATLCLSLASNTAEPRHHLLNLLAALYPYAQRQNEWTQLPYQVH